MAFVGIFVVEVLFSPIIADIFVVDSFELFDESTSVENEFDISISFLVVALFFPNL